MSKHKIILTAAMFIVFASGCGKEDENGNTAPDTQAELTEDQPKAMEAGAAENRRANETRESQSAQSDVPGKEEVGNRLTSQQESSTIAALLASGLTREQAEAMLAMGDGTPGSAEKVAAIAAMDPRAQARKPEPKESRLTVRFDGVDYPMEFTEPAYCGDFFGISSAGFNAINSIGEERVTKFSYRGNHETFMFTFWRDTVPEQFDPVDSDANFTIQKKGGVVSGFEIVNGSRAGDLNAENVKRFVAEGSTLSYEGPFSAGSDESITIEAVYCPK